MRPTKVLVVFILSFAANVVWEWLHSVLYVVYRQAPITAGVLLHAALVDAIMITGLYVACMIFSSWPWRWRLWLVVIIALVLAIVIERYALATGRWEYAATMPIIPLLGVGLTPIVQLPLLTYLVITFTHHD